MRLVNDAVSTGKRVIVRVDFNEPLEHGELASFLRIEAALPTLAVLHKAKSVLLLAHLGRPEGKIVPGLSLQPVAHHLKKLLRVPGPATITHTPFGPSFLIHDHMQLLENIRFTPEEDAQDTKFAKKMSIGADLFVNDAFSAAHPAVSTTLLPSHLPSVAGLRFAEEVNVLSQLRVNPKLPLVVIIGGAKIEDKLGVVESLAKVATTILIGGAAAKVAREKQLFTDYPNVILAEDGPGFAQGREQDIGPLTIFRFERAIDTAQTIFWSGPLGQIENTRYQEGTRAIAEAVVNSSAYSVIGGGDSLAFMERIGYLRRFSFYSLGGSAMLQFMANGTLPTIQALEENEKKFPIIK